VSRRRRAGQKTASGEVRSYGEGHKRVSGCVSNARYSKLKAQADRLYGGSMYALVQDVMSRFADTLDDN
jgi:hypothetical protein